MLKLIARDCMGKVLKVRTKHGEMLTPTFFPVINPNKLTITPKEIKKEFRWNEIITNAYIIWKNEDLKGKVEEKGLHKFLDFDGVIFTDSGAYQIWQYGDVEITNEQTVEFQKRIGSDIGTFLDVPMPHTIPISEAKKGVRLTIERAKECKSLVNNKTLWVATVQGSVYKHLVSKCAKELRKLDFDYYACGTLKVATDEWRFKEQIDYLITTKRIVPAGKPFHFWGLGHPTTFALFVALGCDSFDLSLIHI